VYKTDCTERRGQGGRQASWFTRATVNITRSLCSDNQRQHTTCSLPSVATKDWHGNGDCGNTAVKPRGNTILSFSKVKTKKNTFTW